MNKLGSTLVVAISTATTALARHPLRAVLTTFGIFVGVLSFTLVVTLGEGAERSIQTQVQQLGQNLLTIRAKSDRASGVSDNSAAITEGDADAIARSIMNVDVVAPTVDGPARVTLGKKSNLARAIGSTSVYLRARNYQVVEGTSWDETQESTGARVVLVGPTIVEDLLGGGPAVGHSLRIGRHLFRVIGVLSPKGQSPWGFDLDNVVLMPLRTMRSKIASTPPGEVHQIEVAVHEGAELDMVQKNIQSLLRQRHRIVPGAENDFSINDQLYVAKSQQGVVDVMKMLLTSIALISLFIGGIGVMNIMLVSVTERSREIGTRLAVGATATDVLIQFLIEAVVLSFLGGGLGIVIATLLMPPLEGLFGMQLWLTPATGALGMLVSMSTGILFGFLPAQRAARLDPVAALRRE